MTPFHSIPKALAIATAATILSAGVAHSAPILWSSVADITGDSDVRTNGTLVAAYNLGGQATTVNGVSFNPYVIPPAQQTPSFVPVETVTVDSNYTLALESFEHEPQTLMNFDTSSPNAPFTGLSAAYQALLGSAAGQNFGDRTTVLALGGLTVGNTYEIQIWVNDSSSSGSFTYGVFLSDAGGQNSANMDPNVLTDVNGDIVAGGLGQFVVGTFTADAISQTINFGRGEIGGGINGFQLRALPNSQTVPEPATLLLIGTGLAGFAARAGARRPV